MVILNSRTVQSLAYNLLRPCMYVMMLNIFGHWQKEGGRILTFFYIRYGMRALCTCRCAQISRRFIILPRRWLSSRIVWKLHVAGSISGPISHKLNFGHNGRRLQIVVGSPTETFYFSVSMYFSRTMVKTQSVHYLF